MSAPKKTTLVELVEAHNISLSLSRISKTSQGYGAWKRALWYAIELSGVSDSYEQRQKIREALKLP